MLLAFSQTSELCPAEMLLCRNSLQHTGSVWTCPSQLRPLLLPCWPHLALRQIRHTSGVYCPPHLLLCRCQVRDLPHRQLPKGHALQHHPRPAGPCVLPSNRHAHPAAAGPCKQLCSRGQKCLKEQSGHSQLGTCQAGGCLPCTSAILLSRVLGCMVLLTYTLLKETQGCLPSLAHLSAAQTVTAAKSQGSLS